MYEMRNALCTAGVQLVRIDRYLLDGRSRIATNNSGD